MARYALVMLASTKVLGPFAKGEIDHHDDGGAFVELADQMEQQLTAGLDEGQIAELIEHDEVS